MGDDEDLTSTVEEQLANEDAPDGSQTQPLSQAELQEENAETSLDQPSDSTS